MLRFQVVPFAISATFGFNLSMKVYARENPYKNGVFLVGFKRKKKKTKKQWNPTSVALIEGKILNLMFLESFIWWYPLTIGYE